MKINLLNDPKDGGNQREITDAQKINYRAYDHSPSKEQAQFELGEIAPVPVFTHCQWCKSLKKVIHYGRSVPPQDVWAMPGGGIAELPTRICPNCDTPPGINGENVVRGEN